HRGTHRRPHPGIAPPSGRLCVLRDALNAAPLSLMGVATRGPSLRTVGHLRRQRRERTGRAMTSHNDAPPPTTSTTGRVLGLTFGGALLLAVVAVGIGTWQGARPRAAADARRSAAATTVSTASARRRP